MAGWLRWPLYAYGTLLLLGALYARPRLLSVESRFLRLQTLAEVARRGGSDAALNQLQRRLIVLLAMAEVPAVCGFVLFAVGGALQDFYLLAAASLLGLLALAPRRDLWEEVARIDTRP